MREYILSGRKFKLKQVSGSVEDCYSNVVSEDSEFPYIVNIHNMIPDIYNNYFSFNQKRLQIYNAAKLRMYPSAVGIGHAGNELCVTYLRAANPFKIHRSLLQTPPEEYPSCYGSPRFSRAVSVGKDCFISGTASIIGSKTICPNDTKGQVKVLIDNLTTIGTHTGLAYHCYLQNKEDENTVIDMFAKSKIPLSSLTINDLCREDLMVEVEAVPIWMSRSKYVFPKYHFCYRSCRQ